MLAVAAVKLCKIHPVVFPEPSRLYVSPPGAEEAEEAEVKWWQVGCCEVCGMPVIKWTTEMMGVRRVEIEEKRGIEE